MTARHRSSGPPRESSTSEETTCSAMNLLHLSTLGRQCQTSRRLPCIDLLDHHVRAAPATRPSVPVQDLWSSPVWRDIVVYSPQCPFFGPPHKGESTARTTSDGDALPPRISSSILQILQIRFCWASMQVPNGFLLSPDSGSWQRALLPWLPSRISACHSGATVRSAPSCQALEMNPWRCQGADASSHAINTRQSSESSAPLPAKFASIWQLACRQACTLQLRAASLQ